MAMDKKDVQIHSFDGGLDSDTAPELMPPNRARFMLNVRSHANGEKGVIVNVRGNVMVTTALPPGDNFAHGWAADEQNHQFYFLVRNSNGYHTTYMYDSLKNAVSVVLQSKTDSNNVDIFNFDKDHLVNHFDVIPTINGPLLTWCDGYNKAVKFNRNKAIDKSSTGYGLIIFKDYIVAYKKCSVYAPVASYYTDITRTSNFLYGKLFKFCVRFIYDDGEYSNWSDWSLVPLPPNQSYSGVNNITYDNNCIRLQVETGNALVIKIEVAMKLNDLDFVTTVVLDKTALKIQSDSTYTYNFYNDGADTTTDQSKIIRQYSFLPDKPWAQSFVKNAMTYSKFFEGFESISIQLGIAVSYKDLFIPDGTQNQVNSPSFIPTLITNGYSSGSLGFNKRYNGQWKFQVGFDVKAGNKFVIAGRNGASFNFNFSYVATSADTAITVANKFKSFMRGIGRGMPDAGNGISAESIDGSGNVIWVYTILGGWNEAPIVWTASVSPVNYQTLKDNGVSVNLIKPGSTRKYAIAYEDDDGRKSLAYTSDSSTAHTDFITQTGGIKQAVHRLSIYNQPPIWAKFYYLLRTPDSGAWINMLIQKVIKVDPDPSQVSAGNNEKYLDLVVGSLFTYQKLHPNTVLVYDFEKGDRLRLIKYYDNNGNKVLYPFIEVEVLSYSIDTEELVNQSLTTHSTDIVNINGVANPDYIGKTLVVNGYERTIIGVPAGDQYQLDSAYVSSESFSSFSIIDHRGILRIKQPNGVTVNDLSLVEIYKPQLNDSPDGYKQFFPFGEKHEIGNYGTATRYHAGTVQNQYQNSATDPAIIDVISGDAYSRSRELPTNTSVPGTQFLIDSITDPGFSDFYKSDLTSLGRVFPQDDGSGVKFFGSRTRFSNNFVQDTKINGLNDFDNLDRKDFNDPFGDIMLTRFRGTRLYIFKNLKTGWSGVLQQRIESADGSGTLITSAKLLSDLTFYAWEGGIGDNPESWVSNGDYQYFASANSGVILRLAGDGCDPISSLYNYDKEIRRILSIVAAQKLKIFGGFDRENSEVVFAVPAYNNYIFNGGFSSGDWITYNDDLPPGTTFQITQQAAHSSAVIDGQGLIQLTAGTVIGPDYFVYRATLPNGTVLPARKECFTVVAIPNRQTGFQARTSTQYCIVRNHGFRAKDGTQFCLTRNVGFRARANSKFCYVRNVGFRAKASTAYCLQQDGIPLRDFDYMVLRYIWANGSGVDLDTFTGFINTGTQYDGNPVNRVNWVGYAQNPNPTSGAADGNSRTVPRGSSDPYLNWGADNRTGSGIEAILVNIKKFIADFPNTPNPVSIKMNTVWYQSVASGNFTVEVTTYKGGTMVLDAPNYNFVNNGGVLVDQIDLPYHSVVRNTSALITASQPTAQMDFDKATNTATLTLK